MSQFTNIALATYGDGPAFETWLLFHGNEMEVFHTLGGPSPLFPLRTLDINDPEQLRSWLDAHYLQHEEVWFATTGGQIPDLRDVDFTDEAQWNTWMQSHLAVHVAQLQVLGLS